MTSPREHVVGGQRLLICGEPDFEQLEEQVAGPGDLWHSGLLRGYRGLFPDLKFWSQTYWWYLNDADPRVRSVSWRVDHTGFAIRGSAWEAVGGLDGAFVSDAMRGFDLGFRILQNGGIPLHVPGLFTSLPGSSDTDSPDPGRTITDRDVYLFFTRHFKREYARYLWLRRTLTMYRPLREVRALRWAEGRATRLAGPRSRVIPQRPLQQPANGRPRVTAIVPTMRRQRYTAALLEDYARQTLPLHEVFVVDATPEDEREPNCYGRFADALPLHVIWQQSLGSCRARNEAIRMATGDYILFADDDTRVPPDFVENHVRLLDTYGAEAATGLDIRADHHEQGLEDLARTLADLEDRWDRVGASVNFNNANACVRREWVSRCVGNDVNFDGGYGEDGDFGLCLIEQGAVVLRNPYSANLHLKPPAGGFRWWGAQSASKRRRKRRQPWELKTTVGWVSPRPSPTIIYGFLKHYSQAQRREWLWVYVLRWWLAAGAGRPGITRIPLVLGRVVATPMKLARVWVSYRFARQLIERGPIFE